MKVLVGYADSPNVPDWSRGGSVQLFEVATGQSLLERPLPHKRMVHAAAFSPDGKTFVTESGIWGDAKGKGLARFWSEDGQEIFPSLERPCMAMEVAFSPDGRQLLTANVDMCARLWNRD